MSRKIPIVEISAALLEPLITLLPVASKDDTRYHMQGIRLRFKAGALELAATDGHILTVLRVTDHGLTPETLAACEGEGFGTVIIPADFVAELKRRKKNWAGSVVTLAEKQVDIKTPGIGTAFFPYIDGRFPEIEAVIPAGAGEGSNYISLNAEYLLRVATALKGLGGHSRSAPGVRIYLPTKIGVDKDDQPVVEVRKLEPIYVDAGRAGGFGVIMPMRI